MAKKTEEEVKKLETEEKEEVKEPEVTSEPVKTTDEMKQQIFDEIHDDVINKIKEDLNNHFDSEYTNEIKERVSNEITADIKEKIKKEDDRNSRRKTFKIIRLYIYLFLMVWVAIYLIVVLYTGEKINLFVPTINLTSTTTESTSSTSTTTTTTTTTTRSQEWYKEQYGHLVNDFKTTNLDILKNGMSVEALNSVNTLSLVVDNLKAEDITQESIIYTISEETIQNKFTEFFGEHIPYEATNFSNQGLSYAYSETGKNYIAVGEKKTPAYKVIYNIKNISAGKDSLVITTYVALLKDNNIYNINDLENSLGEYTDNISDYLASLSTIKFFFKGDTTYYLDSILKQ